MGTECEGPRHDMPAPDAPGDNASGADGAAHATRSERAGTPEFVIEDVTAGAYAHGFGVAADGRPFAFHVVGSMLYLELYRENLPVNVVPDQADMVATAQARVTDIDLDDERSIVAMVRDMIPAAAPVRGANPGETTIVRALLGRMNW